MKNHLLISLAIVGFWITHGQAVADTTQPVVLLPSEQLTINGGPSTQSCSSFTANRDLIPALSQSLSADGLQVVSNTSEATGKEAVKLTVSGFSWECANKIMTARITMAATSSTSPGWSKNFEASQSTPFSAMECWTISCANKKWEGLFYPMMEQLSTQLAREALAAYKSENGARTPPTYAAPLPNTDTSPAPAQTLDLFDLKEKADKLYAKKKDKAAQRDAYDLYTQISKQATNKKLLAEIYDKLDQLERAGFSDKFPMDDISDSETAGVSRSSGFKTK